MLLRETFLRGSRGVSVSSAGHAEVPALVAPLCGGVAGLGSLVDPPPESAQAVGSGGTGADPAGSGAPSRRHAAA